MDRYLLLVICGEGKVSSAAGGEAEHRPGASSVEGTEKQPGKCWAEKAGTACGEKKFEFVICWGGTDAGMSRCPRKL